VPVLDLAGGMVVHISSGVSALACALMLRKRLGYPREPMAARQLRDLERNFQVHLNRKRLDWIY
jgi:ammonia channel protein AmtB